MHPKKRFPDGAGAFEVIARYSYVDLDSAGIQGGELQDWTAGLNWYPGQFTRVMTNYILARPEGFGTEHIFLVRFGIIF